MTPWSSSLETTYRNFLIKNQDSKEETWPQSLPWLSIPASSLASSKTSSSSLTIVRRRSRSKSLRNWKWRVKTPSRNQFSGDQARLELSYSQTKRLWMWKFKTTSLSTGEAKKNPLSTRARTCPKFRLTTRVRTMALANHLSSAPSRAGNEQYSNQLLMYH